MAFPANGTTLANLVNPQVMADLIEKKMIDAIRFTPLATVDTTLVGRPGNTITLPSYNYIGDATDVAEGADIAIAQLTAGTTTATIKKAGKGVQITDEAALSGFGDPLGEAARQLGLAIAAKINKDVLTAMGGASLTTSATARLTPDDVADGLEKFGEDQDGSKVLLVSPSAYTALRKTEDWIPNTEIGADIIMKGVVGMVQGCQVVVSNLLQTVSSGSVTASTAYIVKPDALRIYMKRDILVESDRDIINKSTVITADEHYVAYLYDASKIVKITETI